MTTIQIPQEKIQYVPGTEIGHYANFNFKVTMVYDQNDDPRHGAVHLEEKDNDERIELPIEVTKHSKKSSIFTPLPLIILRKLRKGSRLSINFKPLEIAAIERGYKEEVVDDLKYEIARKIELMNALKKPKGSFLEGDPALAAIHFPELQNPDYLNLVPEKQRKEIEPFLSEFKE
jgi:hypothetical protein